MYCLIVGLNLLLLVSCWANSTILVLAVLVNVAAYLERTYIKTKVR